MASLQDRLNQKMEKLNIPFGVHFDLTYKCNLNCIHCYIPDKKRYPLTNDGTPMQNGAELTTQEIFDILDQLAEYGTLFLSFSGGEIFVRPDIIDILSYARKKRFAVSLLTNGTLINDDIVRIFIDIGIPDVNISIYSSTPEIHDSITGVPGSFNKSIKAIELLKKNGISVKISCPITKKNVKTFKSVIELSKSYDVICQFDPNITLGMDGNTKPSQYRIGDDELKEYYRFITSAPKDDVSTDTTKPKCEDFLKDNPCGASHSSCYISPYGDIQPCIDININCGNLRKRSLKDIWENSQEMLTVRKIKRKDLKKCHDCPEPDYCHRCMGQAYTEHGDILAPSEEFCRHVKVRKSIQDTMKQSNQLSTANQR
jgi:AdoMet-dependent heme synthase